MDEKIKSIVEHACKERQRTRTRKTSQSSDSENEEEQIHQELIKTVYALKKETKDKLMSDYGYSMQHDWYMKERVRLTKEYNEIHTTINLINSPYHQKRDLINIKKLKELAEGQDVVEDEIENEKLRIRETEEQINKIEQETAACRKNIGGIHNAHIKQQQTTHTIKCLEDRLHKTTVEFNELTAENQRLREGIDHLRQERKNFNMQYKRYRKQLGGCKAEQRTLTEKSTIAFDQTDDATSKMSALVERESKNNGQHLNELRELVRHIDHDSCTKEFLITKATDRSAQAEALVASRRYAAESKFEAIAEKTLNEYKRAIHEVMQLTGTNSFEEIIEHYVSMEDANFAQFNFINEMSNKLQETDDKIKLTLKEIATLSDKSNEMVETYQNKLNGLESQRDQVQASLQESTSAASKSTEEISQVTHLIEDIFKSLECDETSINSKLGANGAADSLMIYISEMEAKTSELLRCYQSMNAPTECKSDESQKSVTKKSKSDKNQKAPQVVELPKIEELDAEAIINVRSIRKLAAVSIVDKEIEREKERQAQIAAEKTTNKII